MFVCQEFYFSAIFILVYVDDIVITGSDDSVIHFVITKINNELKLKDIGSLNYFVGMDVQIVVDNTST